MFPSLTDGFIEEVFELNDFDGFWLDFDGILTNPTISLIGSNILIVPT